MDAAPGELRAVPAKARRSCACNSGFDLPLRFVGRDEHFVAVLETEWREVEEQAMLAGHRQMNARDPRACCERRCAHLKQGRLNGRAGMQGKRYKHRFENR